jgi:lipoic acid synthetase
MKPAWIKSRLPSGKTYFNFASLLKRARVNTICEESLCPNISECWGRKTTTFMILGNICTRNCAFCNVKKGKPKPPNPAEPHTIAKITKHLGLKHVVITSPSRDDLKDGGAGVFVETINQIKKLSPQAKVEVLIPDFQGNKNLLKKVLEAQPDVLGHNLEVVPQLQSKIRSGGASYQRSKKILAWAKEFGKVKVKTGIMVGLGETMDEVISLINDLAKIDIDAFTCGQYLQPSKAHPPVSRFYTPQEFEHIRCEAKKAGIKFVQSAPLVRSSYLAHEIFNDANHIFLH